MLKRDFIFSGHQADPIMTLKPDQPRTLGAARQGESLSEVVGRAKAKWLRRVMYESDASSSQKCFAYAVADHLNCVSLDSWPGQVRLIILLGFKSTKTMQRAARGLEAMGLLLVKTGGRAGYRYQPVFLPDDEDKPVAPRRHSSAQRADKNVRQSLLLIQPNLSGLQEEAAENALIGQFAGKYERRQRGAIELKLAEMLKPGGMDVLSRLSKLDDAIVERLCRAYATGALGERELVAARLAAEQARS